MIAHIDVDSFFASVLVRKNPSLKGKPLLALGMGGSCVIAASYEAKDRGVKTGMRLKEALKLVPNAIRMPTDFHEAALGSHEIESLLRRQCPIVETMSIDEWFLNIKSLVGGIPSDISDWAQNMQTMIAKKTDLMVSIGVAPTKTLAKMASDYKKPAGITLIQNSSSIPHTSYYILLQDFLNNRPASAIPGIGRRRMIQTDAHGWKTAWDIAQAPTEELRRLFGKTGVELKEELLGNSLSAVTAQEAPPKSVSRCRSFRPTKDTDLLWAQLLKHLEYIVLKMRRHHLSCRGISVWLRDSEYEGDGANASLPQPSHTADAILPFMRNCFERSYDARMTYTQIALTLWNLVPTGAPQYSLFRTTDDTDRDEAIQRTLDLLHERFGRSSITRGSAMQVKTGTTVTVDISVYE